MSGKRAKRIRRQIREIEAGVKANRLTMPQPERLAATYGVRLRFIRRALGMRCLHEVRRVKVTPQIVREVHSTRWVA